MWKKWHKLDFDIFFFVWSSQNLIFVETRDDEDIARKNLD